MARPCPTMALESNNLADGSKPAVGVANILRSSKELPRQPSALWTLPGCRGNDVGRRDDRVPG
jgi:hypothetical protein